MVQSDSPEPSEASDVDAQDLHLESEVADGMNRGTVVRDREGNIVYPGYVPPDTQSPTSGIPPECLAQPVSPPVSPPDSEPRKTRTEPIKAEAGHGSSGGSGSGSARRPTMGKQWATDLPGRQLRRASTLPPAIRRVGTNASQLQNALWTSYHSHQEFEDSESSSSTSDEEEEIPPYQSTDFAKKSQPQQRRFSEEENKYRRFRVGNENYRTSGKVSRKDGRLAISLKDTSNTGYLAKALGAAVRKVVPLGSEARADQGEKRPSITRLPASTVARSIKCPRLNIVIMVIGSRGDAQPFLKIGKILKEQYGHRVRIATHPAFKEFIEKDSGLEFFSVGGDPAELMAFMVKNPGMIPTLETVKAGDIGRRRAAMAEMFEGFWKACINATDDENDVRNLKMVGEKDPFVADAIIANPPSFAHIHCAEALGIPLHLMFTFPYTPTQAFPHPLANIRKSNVDPGYTNFISYPLVEMMVWQGLGDLVNEFRVKTLGLDPVSTLWAPGSTYRLHVPVTYLWSPGLVPKAADWGDEIDIAGFVFLDLASTFTPPEGLTKFLNSGEMPIYIGFGSIVVDDADRFTEMIFEAVKLAGVRALVSKGWGGLGNNNVPDNVYMLDNTPHDWLFPRVRACVIHGGAGTTAIALKCGKPTMVVPFFGDQHFWGSMIGRSKVGPEPVPYKNLTAERLAEGIKYLLTDEAQKAAEEIAQDIALEGDGAENACESFHRRLPLSGTNSMRCSILGDQIAAWQVKGTDLRLSPLAAYILVAKGHLQWNRLRLMRHCEWNDFEGPGEPVTGITGSMIGTLGEVFGGIGSVPSRLAKSSKKRKERRQKKEVKRQTKEKTKAKSKANGMAHKSSRTEQPSNHTVIPNGTTRTHQADGQHSRGGDNASILTATTSATAENHPAEEIVTDISRGVGKSAQAIARAPIDLSMALAQGFHNAPRLYGDPTVRRPPRVTGIKSGLRAAGKEFAYGIYDGWTGVVRLPVRGARNAGARGFAKGVGMGLTGFVLKDIAALTAPLGYTLKGVTKQVERGRQPHKHVRRARIIQGLRALRGLSEAERGARTRAVEDGWHTMRALWRAVDEAERRRGRGRIGGAVGAARRKRALGPAFGSVEVAGRALAAIRAGEDVGAVVERVRASEEQRAAREPLLGVARARSADSGKVLDDAAEAKRKPAGGPPPPRTVEEKQMNGRA
ncbi:Glycosyltransferase family 1 protein [Pleurostoma richardsiae]|uniref:Glycosyltransferase family 1 protein n=1 Tax=Pleurostoma richardsiae TaxID=41990 RepID=A0AA38RR49_9PEZI|nr:Glycosyltransferase family 1 protein [Pleurostoma richardsiae]